MSVLDFDKNSLGNLEYSLKREMLSTNRAGGYMSTTIVCCNTRKYHGLVVCPIDPNGDHNYVLLSSLDETIVQHGHHFNLAIHRFPGIYEPRGHKYITDFKYTPTPTITYRVGGVILKKELLWIHSQTQLLIRYTLEEAHSETKLHLRPFLAFRDTHSLSKANMSANVNSQPIVSGVKNRLYDNFPFVNMQLDKPNKFIQAPDWYYDFEYLQEKERGYESKEDLLTTGYFEVDIKKGDSVVFSCSTEEVDPSLLAEQFKKEIVRRSQKVDMLSCLRHSARQFIGRHEDRTEVVAGYPWFGSRARDAFISLPGLTLTQGGEESFKEVVDSMVARLKDGIFPSDGGYNVTADTSLWFFWTLQKAEPHYGRKNIWEWYSGAMKSIIEHYVAGLDGVTLHDNGLLWAQAEDGRALTWMDGVVDGVPVTPRYGYNIEVNALWYNALMYMMELSREFDKTFASKYSYLTKLIEHNFVAMFWMEYEGHLADFVDGNGQNWFIRPNQIIAVSLPYCLLDNTQKMSVLMTVRQHLLTPKGLRTLSPRNSLYEGRYEGNQAVRQREAHQGSVWPWLLQFFVEAHLNVLGRVYVAIAEEIIKNFNDDINSYGIGSLPELYDADPPYAARGAVSQAWSVGSILAIYRMVEEYKNK